MPTLTENIRPIAEQISALRITIRISIALSQGDQQLSYEELEVT